MNLCNLPSSNQFKDLKNASEDAFFIELNMDIAIIELVAESTAESISQLQPDAPVGTYARLR